MKKADTPTPLWLTVPQVAQMLQICTDHAYALTHRADFPSVRLGHSIRVDRCALEKWTAAHVGEALL